VKLAAILFIAGCFLLGLLAASCSRWPVQATAYDKAMVYAKWCNDHHSMLDTDTVPHAIEDRTHPGLSAWVVEDRIFTE
jgi:hypothetical protein